jgi:hemoglobin
MDEQPINLDVTRDPAFPSGEGSITLEKIRELVELFYSRTQQDELLGPIFEERVADWDAHYEKMTRFWASATLHTGTYSGRPIEAHKFGGLTKAHFDRWIELFTQTAGDVFAGDDAAIFVNLGQKMASSIAMRIGAGRFSY